MVLVTTYFSRIENRSSVSPYPEIENFSIPHCKEEILVTTTFNTTKSQEIFAAAQNLMPGGVSSPVRAFKSVGGQPIVFERVNGAYIWDVDGNQYIDYVGTWGHCYLWSCSSRSDYGSTSSFRKWD